MLDIGWQELLVIGVLALLVVAPKELPGMLRTLGRYAGKARSMAREFQRSMEDAAREADLDELNKLKNVKGEVEKMARFDFKDQAKRVQSSLSGGGKSSPRTTAPEADQAPADGGPGAAAEASEAVTPSQMKAAAKAAVATPVEPAGQAKSGTDDR